MKMVRKTFIISVFLFLIIPDNLFAQGPPPWAPAHGYRAKTKHIYFPDQNFYYDIERHNYIYLNHGNWSISATIPAPFININLGRTSQIQLDFVGPNPYRENSVHVVKYKKVKVKHNKPGKQHGKPGKHGHGHGH